MARRPLFIKLSLCQWGGKAGKVCKIQGTKEKHFIFHCQKSYTSKVYKVQSSTSEM